MQVLKAEFICSLVDPEKTPLPSLPVVALLGRSNVGKSSLINRLSGRKALARASSTPGRTAEVVCFQIELQLDSGKKTQLILADFPGFGYAKRSGKEKSAMSEVIHRGLLGLPGLSVVCVLNDCRREPEEEELWVRDAAFERGCHVIVALTKCDKLAYSALLAKKKEIAAAYQLQPGDLEPTGEKIPGKNLWLRVAPLVEVSGI